jgi:hypothetical protein
MRYYDEMPKRISDVLIQCHMLAIDCLLTLLLNCESPLLEIRIYEPPGFDETSPFTDG